MVGEHMHLVIGGRVVERRKRIERLGDHLFLVVGGDKHGVSTSRRGGRQRRAAHERCPPRGTREQREVADRKGEQPTARTNRERHHVEPTATASFLTIHVILREIESLGEYRRPSQGCASRPSATFGVVTETSRSYDATGVVYVHTATLPPLGADTWIHSPDHPPPRPRRLRRARGLPHRGRRRTDADVRGDPRHPRCAPRPRQPWIRARWAVDGRQGDRLLGARCRPSRALLGWPGWSRRRGIRIVHTSDRPRDAFVSVLLARLTGRDIRRARPRRVQPDLDGPGAALVARPRRRARRRVRVRRRDAGRGRTSTSAVYTSSTTPSTCRPGRRTRGGTRCGWS